MRISVTVEGRPFEIDVADDGTVSIDGTQHIVDLSESNGQPSHSLLLDGRSFETQVRAGAQGDLEVIVNGRPYRTRLASSAASVDRAAHVSGDEVGAEAESQTWVKAPLPGLLVETRVSNGDKVLEGDVVAVLESMKMHLELRAPQAGIVSSLSACPGQEIDLDEVLAIIV